MEYVLNRLRQKYGSIQAAPAKVTRVYRGTPFTWQIPTPNNMGESKNFLDCNISLLPIKGNKRQKQKARTFLRTKFKPAKISSTVKGNELYDGDVFVNFITTAKIPSEYTIEGAVLSSFDYDSSQYPFIWDHNSFQPIDVKRAQWCLMEASRKANNPVHEFGTTLGEIRETAGLIVSPLKGITRMCVKNGLANGHFVRNAKQMLFYPHHKVRKKRRFGLPSKLNPGAHIVDHTTDFWLTWRFGLQPLLREINDVMCLDWSKYDTSNYSLARQATPMDWSQIAFVNAANLGNNVYINYEDVTKYRTVTRATVAYAVHHGVSVFDFLNGYGLSARQIPGTLWELMPLSFVVDRFSNIGTFIKGLTPDPRVTNLETCISTKFEAYSTRKMTNWYEYAKGTITRAGVKTGAYRQWLSKYSRDIGEKIPIYPQFVPKLLNLKQQADHASLAWQRLPKWR